MHIKERSIYNGRYIYINYIQPGRFYKKNKEIIKESLSGAAARTSVERKNE